MTQLQPLDSAQAIKMYLTERRAELSDDTLYNHEMYLKRFREWCDREGFDNMNDISGRDLHEFRQDRADDLAQSSLQTQISTVRTFIRFCESIDAVEPNLSEKVLVPPRPGNSRDEKLDPDRADAILSYLEKYEYASRNHALFLTLWHTGMRMGAAQSLDLGDFDRDNQSLALVHRPENGTSLKNAEDGERLVALSEDVAQVIADYIDHKRKDQVDDYGREPLFTTKKGRLSKTTIQTVTYKLTRPCTYSGDCPHGYDPDECEWTGYHTASGCPSSVSPHPIRRGSITWQLTSGPTRAVGDRCDVSNRVLEEHYDRRSEHEKMQQRRQVLDI